MTQFLVKVGDCRDVLRRLPAGCVDFLIVTSPPYADARIDTYGGVHPDECVEWFLPRSGEFPTCAHTIRHLHLEHQGQRSLTVNVTDT